MDDAGKIEELSGPITNRTIPRPPPWPPPVPPAFPGPPPPMRKAPPRQQGAPPSFRDAPPPRQVPPPTCQVLRHVFEVLRQGFVVLRLGFKTRRHPPPNGHHRARKKRLASRFRHPIKKQTRPQNPAQKARRDAQPNGQQHQQRQRHRLNAVYRHGTGCRCLAMRPAEVAHEPAAAPKPRPAHSGQAPARQ